MQIRMHLSDALDIAAGSTFLAAYTAINAVGSTVSKALTGRQDFRYYGKKCYENMVIDCN